MNIKDRQLKLIGRILKTEDETLLKRLEMLFHYDFPSGSALTEEQFDKIEERHHLYHSKRMDTLEWKKAKKKIRKS